MKRWTAAALTIGAAAAAITGIAWFDRPLEVRVVHPHRGEAVEVVYATGFVEPERPVSLSSRITAPVLAVHAEEGQSVGSGQPLITLDSTEQGALLAQARAQRLGAEQKERRVVALFRDGWSTRAARDEAVAAAGAARASERAAAARVVQGLVRAPFGGIVLKREVEPGDLAIPGAVLMQLGDPARTRITVTVDERDILAVRPDQEVLLSSDALGERVLKGFVQAITPGGDPNQRAFRVRLRLAEPVELPFGLTLEANILTKRNRRALLVPASAYSAGTVWTVDDRNRLRTRRVKVGIVGPDNIEIVGGLGTRDRVVANKTEDLEHGTRVRIAR